MLNYKSELTYDGGRPSENTIHDIIRLVELGMIGISDLAAEAIRHIGRSFNGNVMVEYYAGHIIYGETIDRILTARHQVLNRGFGTGSEFPKIDQVISRMYYTNAMVDDTLYNLFNDEYEKVVSDWPNLHRELLMETTRRITSAGVHIKHDTIFIDTHPLV
ncbi:hypothetical protein UFOVP972_139 [uncultured Caudovirales phage]|uniref:Uncharacterized protein n=1 Tax=uncultured Caudovirales phage TaxID=2100421 RepID=A0A6J5PTP5_9CAUD|nr:hypothetical protein UFOVP972_139 [uncultured Caudovirales phage]